MCTAVAAGAGNASSKCRTGKPTQPGCFRASSCSSIRDGNSAMSAASLDLRLDYLPRLPRRKDFRIGCIGAGFIMRDCHLVAYRQAGFNPVAIASRDAAHARAVAEARGISCCHATVAALLADPSVEVLDIAVP